MRPVMRSRTPARYRDNWLHELRARETRLGLSSGAISLAPAASAFFNLLNTA